MSFSVLFVDDEPGNSENNIEYFGMFGFTDVSEVRTPAEAVDAIQKNRPDLVFLDISLGERETMNGIDVLKIVHKTTPESKVVMLSSYDHFRGEAMENGAYDYVTKPCRPKVLLELAKKLKG
jgi:two-component system chemotaxis response regulator CheY